MAQSIRSREHLLAQIRDTLRFYDPRAVDPRGGFFHFFTDDGTIYDRATRHLVSSTRFVFDYAVAHVLFGDAAYLDRVRHGVDYLRAAHRNPDTRGYAWELHGDRITDATNHCYGLAFVLLAYAFALHAGVERARAWIDETWTLLEEKFWREEDGLYASEASFDWKLSAYRGQNDNMHACEAMIAAHVATGELRYLERAETIAESITVRLAAKTGGWIWEHYTSDWSPDLHYNKRDPANLFRPWGVQTGHQTEWAKLLLVLDRHQPKPWHLDRARELFDRTLPLAWDEQNGGLIYGLDLEGAAYDRDKYHWVQAESIAAAALLAMRTGRSSYWDSYDRMWSYCLRHFVDHEHGAWYRILTPENAKYDDRKSPAGKTDYHNLGACWEILNESALPART